jgi:hypothetical protein
MSNSIVLFKATVGLIKKIYQIFRATDYCMSQLQVAQIDLQQF